MRGSADALVAPPRSSSRRTASIFLSTTAAVLCIAGTALVWLPLAFKGTLARRRWPDIPVGTQRRRSLGPLVHPRRATKGRRAVLQFRGFRPPSGRSGAARLAPNGRVGESEWRSLGPPVALFLPALRRLLTSPPQRDGGGRPSCALTGDRRRTPSLESSRRRPASFIAVFLAQRHAHARRRRSCPRPSRRLLRRSRASSRHRPSRRGPRATALAPRPSCHGPRATVLVPRPSCVVPRPSSRWRSLLSPPRILDSSRRRWARLDAPHTRGAVCNVVGGALLRPSHVPSPLHAALRPLHRTYSPTHPAQRRLCAPSLTRALARSPRCSACSSVDLLACG